MIIIKILKEEYPTLGAITRLKHEYQIRRNLEQANQQLEEYSQTLEEKVEQRTAALEAAQKQIIAKEKPLLSRLFNRWRCP